MNKSRNKMQVANPIHTFDIFSIMNRDKLPFPEKLPYTTTSSDTVRVNNFSQQTSNHLKRQLSTATYRPTGRDIICGRGRGSFLHEGNRVYLSLLRNNLHAYLAASKRVEKSVIISTVVSSLKERGFRFLKQDEKNERWYELSESESYDRTAHAIRDLIRKQKGRNKQRLSATPRSPSPSNSDISVSSSKTDEPSKPYPIPLTSMSNANTSLSASNLVPSLDYSAIDTTTQVPADADSFDEKISQIPSEVMSPTDRLKDGGFDVFFEFEPDDFGQVLSQLDTDIQERRASLESQS